MLRLVTERPHCHPRPYTSAHNGKSEQCALTYAAAMALCTILVEAIDEERHDVDNYQVNDNHFHNLPIDSDFSVAETVCPHKNKSFLRKQEKNIPFYLFFGKKSVFLSFSRPL